MATDLAGMALANPLILAAGFVKTAEDLVPLLDSDVAVITVGSGTVEPRQGNPGNVYWAEGPFSLNSIGLTNPGISYYQEKLPGMVRLAEQAGKRLFFSAAGFSPQEFADLAEMSVRAGVHMVEINFGCPNIREGDEQKRIFSFYPDLIETTLGKVNQAIGETKAQLAVKLSPFSNPEDLVAVAEVVAGVDVVVTSNTFPNGYMGDGEGNPRIEFANGLAGLAGPAMKPIALGQVLQLRGLLMSMGIIGVGGVSTGQDVMDLRRVGADAVAVGTAYKEEGPGVFARILGEFAEISQEAVPSS